MYSTYNVRIFNHLNIASAFSTIPTNETLCSNTIHKEPIPHGRRKGRSPSFQYFAGEGRPPHTFSLVHCYCYSNKINDHSHWYDFCNSLLATSNLWLFCLCYFLMMHGWPAINHPAEYFALCQLLQYLCPLYTYVPGKLYNSISVNI